MEATEDLEIIYSNNLGVVYQCDKTNKLYLEFSGETTGFTVPCFFCFKKMVSRIDLVKLASDITPGGNIEILSPCGTDRCFVLDFQAAEALKDLMEGSRVMMDLNSILHERLRRVPVC